MTELELMRMAGEIGYNDGYFLDAEAADRLPDGYDCIWLLLKAYEHTRQSDRDLVAIHPYYLASQEAYNMAKKLAERLQQMDIDAIHLPNIRLKPVAARAENIIQRRNTLTYHPQFGSRFHLQAIGFKNRPAKDRSANILRSKIEECGKCHRCVDACPAHAIGENGVDRSRCLREHMLSGKAFPVDLRKLSENMLIGCDICQQVCPHNRKSSEAEPLCIEIEALLPPDSELLNTLKQSIGVNLANRNRITAQACILAGNSGNLSYRAALNELVNHPSSVVAEHARWAIEQLSCSVDSDAVSPIN